VPFVPAKFPLLQPSAETEPLLPLLRLTPASPRRIVELPALVSWLVGSERRPAISEDAEC
jgi:hypothetical protein